ncbi:MAG: hypothetical protein ABW128_06215 [Rhizorhabdus sp.]
MRILFLLAIAALPSAAAAQELPMTREGLDSALAQYFAGADRNGDGQLDRPETAAILGFARSMLTAKHDEEPFVMDVGPDGRPRLTLNENGPLSQGGMADLLYRRTDANSDGVLSVAEVQAAGREAFDLADRDHDGILDDQERTAAQKKIGLLSKVFGG